MFPQGNGPHYGGKSLVQYLMDAPDTILRDARNLKPRLIRDTVRVANADLIQTYDGSKQFAGTSVNKNRAQLGWEEMNHPWGRQPGWIAGLRFIVPQLDTAAASPATWFRDIRNLLGGLWTIKVNTKVVTWGLVTEWPQGEGIDYQAGEATAAAPPTAQNYHNGPPWPFAVNRFAEPFFLGPQDNLQIDLEYATAITLAASVDFQLALESYYLATVA